MVIFQKIDRWLSEFFIFLIKIYQYILSPDKWIPSLWLKWKICMHEPHCSEYGIKVLRRYGILKWLFLTSDRVLHCTWGMNKIYDPEFYKVVFFSSAPIGVSFLNELSKDKKFEIVGVVTQCDKPAWRWMAMCENVIKTEAKKIFENNIIDNVLLLDGFGGDGTSNRFPRLKKILEAQWIMVYNPCPVNTNEPLLEDQLEYLMRNYADKINEKTAIIWHSLWCLLANHFITTLWKKVGKLISVGPAFRENDIDTIIKKFPWFANSKQLLKDYQNKNFDTKVLERLVSDNIVYTSDNDPFIPFDKVNNYYKNNFSNIKIKHFTWKGHFNESAWIIQLPEILSDILYVYTPNKLNPEKSDEGRDFAEWLKNKEPDFLVVIAYGKIMPQAILDLAKIAPINIHWSLLPKYRWASPIQSIFLNNEKETWITIMKMDASMDTWNMIEKLKFKIPFDWTCKDVIEKMKDIWPKFLDDVLWKYGKNMLGEEAQKNDDATYCSKIEKEIWLIDIFKDELEIIYNKYRWFYLRPKIYFIWKDKRVIIEEFKLDEKLFEENKKNPLTEWKNLNPSIIEIKVKPEWKKSMSWEEFVRWYIK